MKAYKNTFNIVPLELCDEYDNVIETVQVRTDYLAMRNRLMVSLGELQKLSVESASDEELGRAVCDLIEGIYGKEGGSKIVAYFEENYTALITVVTSHIYEDILPALNRLVDEKRKQAKNYGKGHK